MKRFLFFLAGIIALIFVGCGVFDSERIVEGEVFVVTRGGDNIALGSVDIAFIDADQFNEVLGASVEKFFQDVDAYQASISASMDKLNELKALEKTNWEEVVVEGKSKNAGNISPNRQFDASFLLWDIKSFITFDFDRRKSRLYYPGNLELFRDNTNMKTIQEYYNTLRKIDEQEILIKEEVLAFEWFLMGESLLGEITKNNSSAKTNSQGKFEGIIKKNKDYFIVAKGSRQVGNEKEVYLWVFPIAKGKDDISHLFLSNDNLSSKEEILSLLSNAN